MVGEIKAAFEKKPGWVHVGRLGRARGNRGEILAEIYSTQPGRAERLREVRLEKGATIRIAHIEQLWYHGGRPVLKFAGIDSISQAELWENADILVDDAERVRPEEGEYSHADLIGCTVVRGETGETVGVVRAIDEYGGPAVLQLQSPAGREILVPFAREICREIDVDRKQIRAWLPPGLTELE